MIPEKLKEKIGYLYFKVSYYFQKYFSKKCNLLIIDNFTPDIGFVGFRVEEINFFLKNINNCLLLTMSKKFFNVRLREKLFYFPAWNYIITRRRFYFQRNKYCNYFNIDKKKIFFYGGDKFKVNGAYCLFLFNAFISLDFFEKNKIPFVFTLLPGGYFAFNNHFSDFMLKKIFSSSMFRGVFVTQKIIYKYILSKGYSKNKIYYSYGGGFCVEDFVLNKKFYKKDKNTFDICFVGFRYSIGGKDKGFDIVCDVAKKIIPEHPFVHFHFVGNNTLTDFLPNKDRKSVV